MSARAPELRGVELVHLHTEGPAPYVEPRCAGSFHANALFVACSEDSTDTTPTTETGTETGSETGSETSVVDTGTPPDGSTDTPSDTPVNPTVETCKKFVEATCNMKTSACCATSGARCLTS